MSKERERETWKGPRLKVERNVHVGAWMMLSDATGESRAQLWWHMAAQERTPSSLYSLSTKWAVTLWKYIDNIEWSYDGAAAKRSRRIKCFPKSNKSSLAANRLAEGTLNQAFIHWELQWGVIFIYLLPVQKALGRCEAGSCDSIETDELRLVFIAWVPSRLFFKSALYDWNSCLVRLKFRKPDQNKAIHPMQLIRYETITQEQAHCWCKLLLVCLLLCMVDLCDAKHTRAAEPNQPL